jgi:hypothetical protein
MAITILGIAVPVLAQQVILHRASKREREKESDKVAEAIEERDKKLHLILGEYPPHAHREDRGEALTADGIRYPNAKFNGH